MLRIHERALDEIREATSWYEARSAGLGTRFVGAIRDTLESLESNPNRFATLETLSPEIPIRSAMVADFPYLVIFELFDKEVFVYAVSHASRRPNYWRRRRRTKREK